MNNDPWDVNYLFIVIMPICTVCCLVSAYIPMLYLFMCMYKCLIVCILCANVSILLLVHLLVEESNLSNCIA